jgi:hypothetical protein
MFSGYPSSWMLHSPGGHVLQMPRNSQGGRVLLSELHRRAWLPAGTGALDRDLGVET